MADVAAFSGSPIHHAHRALPLMAAAHRVVIRILIAPLVLKFEAGSADATDSVQNIHVIVLVVVGLGGHAAAVNGEVVQALARQVQTVERLRVRKVPCLQTLYDRAEGIGRLLELLFILGTEPRHVSLMQAHELLVELLVIESHGCYQGVYLVLLVLYFLGLRHVQNATVHHLVVQGPLLSTHRHRTVESVIFLLGSRRLSAK